eukprot:750854-Hanusia_phi.AAC.4
MPPLKSPSPPAALLPARPPSHLPRVPSVHRAAPSLAALPTAPHHAPTPLVASIEYAELRPFVQNARHGGQAAALAAAAAAAAAPPLKLLR